MAGFALPTTIRPEERPARIAARVQGTLNPRRAAADPWKTGRERFQGAAVLAVAQDCRSAWNQLRCKQRLRRKRTDNQDYGSPEHERLFEFFFWRIDSPCAHEKAPFMAERQYVV